MWGKFEYILTLSMINFSQTLMDFSGCLCCSLGYNEGLSQSFYVDFPCGCECNSMKNIEFIQDNPIKTESGKGGRDDSS